jgi:hypothetical protein
MRLGKGIAQAAEIALVGGRRRELGGVGLLQRLIARTGIGSGTVAAWRRIGGPGGPATGKADPMAVAARMVRREVMLMLLGPDSNKDIPAITGNAAGTAWVWPAAASPLSGLIRRKAVPLRCPEQGNGSRNDP